MLGKADKPSGKSLPAARARLCVLALSVVLCTLALGGVADAAGASTAAPSAGSVPVERQPSGLPRAATTTVVQATSAVAHSAVKRVAVGAPAPPAEATGRVGQALRSTRSGARDATTTATAREAAARPAPGKAEALGNNLARTAAATRAARGVRAVAVNLGLALRAGPVRTPARDAIRTLAVRASATLPKKEAGEAFRHAREKLSGPGAASGAGGALPGPAAAAAGAKGLSAGAIEGSREPAAGLALPAPSLPGTPFPIGEPGGLPGIPAGGPPAQAPAGALAIFPPVPAPAGSSSVAALAGGSEAGLPNAVAAAWPSPAPQRAARAAGATGALSCTAAGAGEPVSEPCAAAAR